MNINILSLSYNSYSYSTLLPVNESQKTRHQGFTQ